MLRLWLRLLMLVKLRFLPRGVDMFTEPDLPTSPGCVVELALEQVSNSTLSCTTQGSTIKGCGALSASTNSLKLSETISLFPLAESLCLWRFSEGLSVVPSLEVRTKPVFGGLQLGWIWRVNIMHGRDLLPPCDKVNMLELASGLLSRLSFTLSFPS